MSGTSRRFPADVVDAVRTSQVLGVRAGMDEHRIIGIWCVVVENRVFVRSWGARPHGWQATFAAEPRGVMQVAGREFPVRAVQTRSDRLKDAVSAALAAKYHTPGSLRWVRDMERPVSRDTTTELVPRAGRVTAAVPATRPKRARGASRVHAR